MLCIRSRKLCYWFQYLQWVGQLIAGVVAARRVGVTTYFQELWDFHTYSFNKAFSIQHSAFSQGHCIGDFFWQRAKRHLGTMMT